MMKRKEAVFRKCENLSIAVDMKFEQQRVITYLSTGRPNKIVNIYLSQILISI